MRIYVAGGTYSLRLGATSSENPKVREFMPVFMPVFIDLTVSQT